MNNKSFVKWTIFAVVCALIMSSGVYCGVAWFQDAHRESYIRGSINLGNQFYAEDFKFIGDTVFLKTTDNENYVYDQLNLAKVPFDGVNKQYRFTFNEYIIYDATYTAGTAMAQINIDFYDTDNKLKLGTGFVVRIRFLSNRTELTISTTGAEQAKLLNQYFFDNNCRIVIEEITGGNL
ncbi:MAG: hypothetical protein NC133_04495 [Prevotella sp.]|nr:hypothetical protein [Prevotella sp.]